MDLAKVYWLVTEQFIYEMKLEDFSQDSLSFEILLVTPFNWVAFLIYISLSQF